LFCGVFAMLTVCVAVGVDWQQQHGVSHCPSSRCCLCYWLCWVCAGFADC
jgi:hypothetical protein